MSRVNKSILEMLGGSSTDCLPDIINFVPTLSSHKNTVKRILNEVFQEHPEWKYSLCALASYPLQKWAYDYRNKLSINSRSIQYFIIHNQESRYFGLDSSTFLENQKYKLKYSEKLLFVTDAYLTQESKVINADEQTILYKIHGGEKTNISTYHINNRYKSALEKFCSEFNYKYKTLYQELIKETNDMDLDISFVYHDIRTLMDIYTEMKVDGYSYGIDVNLKKTMDSIDKCISVIGTCPINNSEKIMDVVKLNTNGTRQVDIAKKMKKSQYYVSTMYNQGIKILSILIWGFSEKAILNMLK